MAKGMEMLFESMGVDITGIKEMINPETVKQTMQGLSNVLESQKRIEQSLLRIEIKLETLPDSDAHKLLLENSDLGVAVS